MPLPYDSSDLWLFTTAEYADADDGIDTGDDVDNTEQYSENEIVLTGWQDGMTIDVKFIEIDGTTQTDKLYINIYQRRDTNWDDGNQVKIATIDCGNDGVAAGYKIKPIVISAIASGKGHYKLGVVSSGSTNTFDVSIIGRYWK